VDDRDADAWNVECLHPFGKRVGGMFFSLGDDSINQAGGNVLNVLLDIRGILRSTRQRQSASHDSNSDFCSEGHRRDSFAEHDTTSVRQQSWSVCRPKCFAARSGYHHLQPATTRRRAKWHGHLMQNTVGVQVRNDDIRELVGATQFRGVQPAERG
jgi:hypothetical protein